MEKYVQTHCHSTFSTLDGISTPEELVTKAVEHGHEALALTDHGTMGGVYRLQKACKKAGIKPILGMEAYVLIAPLERYEKVGSKEKRIRDKYNHMVLLVKDEEGYKNLIKLNYLSNSDTAHFYYKPRISIKELVENHKGLIATTACIQGPCARLLLDGKEKEAKQLFKILAETFKEDFYAELQMNELDNQKIYNSWLINEANTLGVPLILGGDCHYANKGDAATQKMAFWLNSSDEEIGGREYGCQSLFYQGISDFKDFNKEWGFGYNDEEIEGWCSNNYDLAQKCNYEIPTRTHMFLPRQAYDEDVELKERAIKGLCEHFGVSTFAECPEEYRKRVIEELNLMYKKGIARYMLCLADICKWCDDNKISRGVARGSAGGSLITSCIGITKWAIDALKNELIFSRFVSEARLPTCMIDYEKRS